MITSPSGGQVLLDQGYHEITGLAWSGRGKIRRVDVSTDGGRNWRTAQLQEPVHTKALTRFRIDWNWDGGPALLQSRAIDDTGYVQPDYRQLRAVRGTRSIYHNNAIQTWRVDDDRRGEQCPGALTSCGSCRVALVAALARDGLVRALRRDQGRAALRLRQARHAGRDRRLGHRRASRRHGPAAGHGHRSPTGQDVYDAKCASCHGTFGESNDYMVLAGGVGSLAHRRAGAHDRQQAQPRDDAVGLHQPRDAVQRAEDAHARRGLRADRVRAAPERHPARRRRRSTASRSEGEDAQPRRLHDRPRLHDAATASRTSGQRRLHDELRRQGACSPPRCRTYARDSHGNLAEQVRPVGPVAGAKVAVAAAAPRGRGARRPSGADLVKAARLHRLPRRDQQDRRPGVPRDRARSTRRTPTRRRRWSAR